MIKTDQNYSDNANNYMEGRKRLGQVDWKDTVVYKQCI